MGHMAKDTLTRAGNFLVFLPLAHSLATAWYFTLLTGEIKLSDAFPWLFWSYFPALLTVLYFIVTSMNHLFSRRSRESRTGTILWVLSFFLFTAVSLPAYRFARMKATPSRAHP